MTTLKRCLWVTAISSLTAGGAFAQAPTSGTGTSIGITGTGGGIGGLGGSSLGGGSLGGGGLGGQGFGGDTATAPDIGITAGVSSSGVVQQSNILSPYYANPSFAGAQQASGTTIVGPGGFGTTLYSGTGSAAAGTGGRATGARAGGVGGTTGGARTSTSMGITNVGLGGTTGGRTGGIGGTTGGIGGATGGIGGLGGARTGGLGGATGGLGGATGGLGGRTGGFGGTTGLGGANSTNQQLSTGRQVAYTQTLKFGVAPLSTTQLQTDVQSAITTSTTLSTVNSLQATVLDGNVVLLRGVVANEDDAKLVEGMMMLTPGVKGVRNELQYPPTP